MFGAQKPGREIVVFGADDAGREGNPPLPVPKVFGALKMGLVEDGEVQVVLERPAVYELTNNNSNSRNNSRSTE